MKRSCSSFRRVPGWIDSALAWWTDPGVLVAMEVAGMLVDVVHS